MNACNTIPRGVHDVLPLLHAVYIFFIHSLAELFFCLIISVNQILQAGGIVIVNAVPAFVRVEKVRRIALCRHPSGLAAL